MEGLGGHVEEKRVREIRISSLDPEEMLEKAFMEASKAAEGEDVSGLRPEVKARIKEKQRIRTACSRIIRSLSRVYRSIPPRSSLPPFHRDMVDLLGGQRLEESRKRIFEAMQSVRRLRSRAIRKIDRSRSSKGMHMARREAYGRISSAVRSIRADLEYLAYLSPRLREVPTVAIGIPTVVVAGCPNVGKTSLLKAVTGSSPEIRPIPFTTKTIQIGHLESRFRRIQILDTPGLLDRPPEERNPMERKALEAIEHLSDLVLYVIDPTTLSGFTLEDQIGLLGQLQELFSKPIWVVVNKTDVATPEQILGVQSRLGDQLPLFKVSCESLQGIQELKDRLSSYLIEKRAD